MNINIEFDSYVISKQVPTQRVMEITLTPPAPIAKFSRSPMNIAIVIDRSGSMAGEKLDYVKLAANHILDLLQPVDKVAIITYDTDVAVITPGISVNPENISMLKKQILSIKAGNMTNLSGGWLTGCQQVAESVSPGTINRVLLLTDGLANREITDLEELGFHASQLFAKGISTSTFGVGLGFNEHLLEHMANSGGGRFYYIEHPHSLTSMFEKEFIELSTITAVNVQVEISYPTGISAQLLGGWRSEQQKSAIKLWLGDISHSQTRQVYIKLLTPPAQKKKSISFKMKVTFLGESGEEYMTENKTELRYVGEEELTRSPQSLPLMQRFSEVEMSEKVTEALKLERAGQREKARSLISTSLMAAAPYVSPELADEYTTLSDRMQHGLQESDRKTVHQTNYNRKQRRDTQN